jgi:hypothetical protein
MQTVDIQITEAAKGGVHGQAPLVCFGQPRGAGRRSGRQHDDSGDA